MSVNEKPILFKTDMIKAILNENKNVTRRIIKPQPKYIQILRNGRIETSQDGGFDNDVKYLKPKYQKGMELWVRETYMNLKKNPVMGAGAEKYKNIKFWYRADNEGEMEISGKWKPSIFMPKEASRITLIVKDVKVERIQDISAEDCFKEGINVHPIVGAVRDIYAKTEFKKLWDSINAQPKPKFKNKIITYYESYPWSQDTADKREKINGKPHYCYSNPWVFRIAFEVK